MVVLGSLRAASGSREDHIRRRLARGSGPRRQPFVRIQSPPDPAAGAAEQNPRGGSWRPRTRRPASVFLVKPSHRRSPAKGPVISLDRTQKASTRSLAEAAFEAFLRCVSNSATSVVNALVFSRTSARSERSSLRWTHPSVQLSPQRCQNLAESEASGRDLHPANISMSLARVAAIAVESQASEEEPVLRGRSPRWPIAPEDAESSKKLYSPKAGRV